QILIDRFAGYNPKKDWNKPQFIGGNIKGIIDRLPYLKNLGVNTLWISPFYKTSEYHGYHVTNFYEVEPHFGNKMDLKRLINLSHQNNMKIIADFVPNHTSKHHPYFKEAQLDKNSKYVDWFHFTNWPNNYLCFLSEKELPKLNLKNPDTRKHIINAAKYWLAFGVDGYRLDHVIGPSNKFWNIFSKEIKTEFPDTILIGEAWMKGISWNELKTIQIPWKRLKWIRKHTSDNVLSNYKGLLDGVLDFTAQQLFQQHLCHQNPSPHKLKKALNNHYKKFPPDFFLPIFLDNHDMDRFLFQCKNNITLLKKAITIQFSIHQPKIIYYGTEQQISQQKSVWSTNNHGDLQARKPMPWTDKNEDNELYNFYRNIITNKQ
ncbi:MAG: hypothetical protein KGY50_02140, partial [Candidatus Thermoplasmatota archaeon]|nr:hypothetical protein [Candidatus Thermoplasmatota archaeon]